MFSLIKQVFIVLLSFSNSLAPVAKVSGQICLSLSVEPCMLRFTLIDLNPVELKYYSLMISLGKCSGSCNVLLPKICVLRKQNISVKAFNMITNKNEAKTMVKHISCDCKCTFNSTTCNSNQK